MIKKYVKYKDTQMTLCIDQTKEAMLENIKYEGLEDYFKKSFKLRAIIMIETGVIMSVFLWMSKTNTAENYSPDPLTLNLIIIISTLMIVPLINLFIAKPALWRASGVLSFWMVFLGWDLKALVKGLQYEIKKNSEAIETLKVSLSKTMSGKDLLLNAKLQTPPRYHPIPISIHRKPLVFGASFFITTATVFLLVITAPTPLSDHGWQILFTTLISLIYVTPIFLKVAFKSTFKRTVAGFWRNALFSDIEEFSHRCAKLNSGRLLILKKYKSLEENQG